MIGDLSWQPSAPSSSLVRTALSSSRAWQGYLAGQGYTDDEARVLLDGIAGDGLQPGLSAVVRDGLAVRQVDDRGPDAVAGLVVGYLELRPPVEVLDLPTAPPRHLSPEDMGRRLEATGNAHELGAGYADRMTGAPWIVAMPSREQAGAMVIGSALFRRHELAAPRWRLVELGGRVAVACERPTHWHRGAASAELLEAQRPIDLWLGYDASVRGRVRVRLNPIPGLPVIIRWDMRTVLGYSAAGRRDSSFGSRFRPPALGLAHVPALRRVVALGEAVIRRGVSLGDLPNDQAADLHGALIARREVLRGVLQGLASG